MKIKIHFLFFLAMIAKIIFSAELQQEKILLEDIINDNKYLNKTITMELRLKYVDNIFNKIVFYDKKNYDIAFDIYDLKKKKGFSEEIHNAKPGLVYTVTFTVKKVITEFKLINGDLIGFKPVILDNLPYGKKQ